MDAKRIGYLSVSALNPDWMLQLREIESAHCDIIFLDDPYGIVKQNMFNYEADIIICEWERVVKSLRRGDVLIIWNIAELKRFSYITENKYVGIMHIISVIIELYKYSIHIEALRDKINTKNSINIFDLCCVLNETEYILRNKKEFKRNMQLDIPEKISKFPGRPSKLSPEDKENIVKSYKEGKTVWGLAKFYNVSIHTIYRAIPDELLPDPRFKRKPKEYYDDPNRERNTWHKNFDINKF